MEPVRLLRERGIEPHLHYANSNIAPAEEYARRRDTIAAWAADESLELTEGAYRPEAWRRAVGAAGTAAAGAAASPTGAGAEGSASDAAAQQHEDRCRACYRLRFSESARYAREHGFDALGTTLSVSPYQFTDIIREELERACAHEGIACFFEDYSSHYAAATRRSREAGLYRQDYCGCLPSKAEADAERAERKAAREERKAARAREQAAAEAELQARREERAAYDAKRARKRAILKELRASNKEQFDAR